MRVVVRKGGEERKGERRSSKEKLKGFENVRFKLHRQERGGVGGKTREFHQGGGGGSGSGFYYYLKENFISFDDTDRRKKKKRKSISLEKKKKKEKNFFFFLFQQYSSVRFERKKPLNACCNVLVCGWRKLWKYKFLL